MLLLEESPNIKWKNINIASGKLAQAPLYIDDTPALSILDLRSRARRLKERNIELLIVDYLQLMQGPKILRIDKMKFHKLLNLLKLS